MHYQKYFVILTALICFLFPDIGLEDSHRSGGGMVSVKASEPLSKGMAALEKAGATNKYLFIFFYKSDDETTISKRTLFDKTLSTLNEKADALAIKIDNPTESEFVKKFEAEQAPMPLVLAVASNGAVTAGFPVEFTAEKLKDAFATPCMEKSLRALQDQKIVLVCIQNDSIKASDTAMKGVKDFKSDSQYSKFTEIIKLDPSDIAERDFLENLLIETAPEEAITLLMVPPGNILKTFTGATTKAEIVQVITKAGANCGPGSSPGCCPSK